MTRDELITELRAMERDLLAFKQARDCIYTRLRELDNNPERQALLQDWPAFRVIDSGLIIAIVKCEGLIEDYRNLLDQEPADNVIPLGKTHDIVQ